MSNVLWEKENPLAAGAARAWAVPGRAALPSEARARAAEAGRREERRARSAPGPPSSRRHGRTGPRAASDPSPGGLLLLPFHRLLPGTWSRGMRRTPSRSLGPLDGCPQGPGVTPTERNTDTSHRPPGEDRTPAGNVKCYLRGYFIRFCLIFRKLN